MSDITAETAGSLLREAGLTNAVFEPGEVAADLTSRVTLSDTLNELLTATPGLDPIAFDPNWNP